MGNLTYYSPPFGGGAGGGASRFGGEAAHVFYAPTPLPIRKPY